MPVRQITDIVKALVEELELIIDITGNVDNLLGNHVLSMENTYYLTKLKVITIGGFDYRVTGFVFNESITIEPVGHTNSVTALEFDLPAPLFFHGTIPSTDKEVIRTMQSTPNSYPIIYLLENIRERFALSMLDYLERHSDLTMFFLDISNYADNDNPAYLEDVLKPLSNLEARFIEVLNVSKVIGQLKGEYTRTNLAKFAIEERGEKDKLIFSEELSGIEIGITLPINRC